MPFFKNRKQENFVIIIFDPWLLTGSAKEGMLKLSLSTLNTPLFIFIGDVFVSKTVKNDLIHARIFRGLNCCAVFKSTVCYYAFLMVSKEHYWERSLSNKTCTNSEKSFIYLL